jgi:hypothetical protein
MAIMMVPARSRHAPRPLVCRTPLRTPSQCPLYLQLPGISFRRAQSGPAHGLQRTPRWPLLLESSWRCAMQRVVRACDLYNIISNVFGRYVSPRRAVWLYMRSTPDRTSVARTRGVVQSRPATSTTMSWYSCPVWPHTGTIDLHSSTSSHCLNTTNDAAHRRVV